MHFLQRVAKDGGHAAASQLHQELASCAVDGAKRFDIRGNEIMNSWKGCRPIIYLTHLQLGCIYNWVEFTTTGLLTFSEAEATSRASRAESQRKEPLVLVHRRS